MVSPALVSGMEDMTMAHNNQMPPLNRPDGTKTTPAAAGAANTKENVPPKATAAKVAGPSRLADRKHDTIETPHQQRSSSPSGSDSDVLYTPKSAASPSSLNAKAAEFVPSPDKPHSVPGADSFPSPPLFEIKASALGGHGVFAAGLLPMGTRVICDSPLLKIPSNFLHLVWEPYCALNKSQKQGYDDLYCWKGNGLSLESASRLHLLDCSVDSDDEDDIIAEHIRVMSIFAVNNFQVGGSGLGLFANGARLNHSCVPNVHHSYNSQLDKLTVHAIRDILPGEELVMNYIGPECHTWITQQRREYLRTRYGFTCQCVACTDSTGLSDARHELYGGLIWGIEQFQIPQEGMVSPLVPPSADAALSQAEDTVTLLIMQGLLGSELTRAYRAAAHLALDIGHFDKAVEYASNEAEVERNIYGSEVKDLMETGTACALWVETIYRVSNATDYKPAYHLAVKIAELTGVVHPSLAYTSKKPKHPKKRYGKKDKPWKKYGGEKSVSPEKQAESNHEN